MITALFNLLPDWAVGFVLAAALWFGVNYFWLGPAYFEANPPSSQNTRSTCSAQTIQIYGNDFRSQMATYTASFGMLESYAAIINRICNEARG